ncbi:MAG TPA: Spx/MgsR family RNA polymerase-binding regulatory protein [Opitutus sp.]|nr:Spx/MgsR family RNA polymerase-binding regulatory protein [Opitutus sp.]
MLTIYTYANCETCRKATKWLRARGVAFAEKPIRETPPSRAELKAVLAAMGGERRKVFNVAGRDYRDLKLGEKLDAMSDSEVLGLLAGNGNLVKRPFVVGAGVGLVGFNEAEWARVWKG